MSYLGDSDAKRVVRALAIGSALTNGPAVRRAVCLAGPEAAEARVLKAFGVDDVYCVENDAEVAARARAHWPAVEIDDVRRVCWRERRRFDLVSIDLCAQLGPKSVRLIVQSIAFGAREGGSAIAGVSYGREAGARREAVKQVSDRLDGVRADLDLRGETLAPTVRWIVFAQLADEAARSFGVRISMRQAWTYTGHHTPMLYCVMQRTKGRPGFDMSEAEPLADVTGDVRAAAITFARNNSAPVRSTFVAGILNLPEPQVRAWLAVETREGRA